MRLYVIHKDLAFWNRSKIGKLEDNLTRTDSQISNLYFSEAKRSLSHEGQLNLSSLINKSKAIS